MNEIKSKYIQFNFKATLFYNNTTYIYIFLFPEFNMIQSILWALQFTPVHLLARYPEFNEIHVSKQNKKMKFISY